MLGLALSAAVAVAEPPQPPPKRESKTEDVPNKIEPVAKIQDAIRAVMRAETKAKSRRLLVPLAEMADDDYKLVVRQIVYYFLTVAKEPKGEKEAWEPHLVIGLPQRMALTPGAVEAALIPYLESDDPKLAWAANIFLFAYEQIEWYLPQPRFHYEGYLRNREDNPPRGLIRYMFNHHPAAALVTLRQAFLKADGPERQHSEPILRGLRVVDTAVWKKQNDLHAKDEAETDALGQLDVFSKHEKWWVRMYAAEILRRYPDLGNKEMIERLKEDKHRLVRETFTTPQPQPHPEGWLVPPKQEGR
jgi:hypothetical protein